MRLSVRGIYSTALIRLLLDNGFKVVKPTRSQVERFGLERSEEEPEAVIVDSADRHFVEVKGVPEVVETVVETIAKAFDDLVAIWRLRGGAVAQVRLGFPVDAKKRMDELRSKVAYTVPWHHYCRAGGEALSSMVSFAEDLVERGLMSPEEMDKMFEERVREMKPKLGARVRILHVKLGGGRIVMGPAKVVRRKDEEIKVQRRIMRGGVYDGLGVLKSPGDHAITEIKWLKWWTKTSYYSLTGAPKGTYYNICTPVALYPDHIHYFDLEVDVVVSPGGDARIIDMELLEQAMEEGRISRWLAERAVREAERIASEQP